MLVKHYSEFLTVTAHDWLPVLLRVDDKRIITDSLLALAGVLHRQLGGQVVK